MNTTLTQEEVDEIFSHLSLKQMEQLTTRAMRDVLKLCPTARLVNGKQPTGEICMAIVTGYELLTEWQPYSTNMKTIFNLWCEAASQLTYQPKLFIVGRA